MRRTGIEFSQLPRRKEPEIPNIVLLPMPYGCLNSGALSGASRKALERALDQWQKTMQISKPTTYLVLASFEVNSGPELELAKEMVSRSLTVEECASQVIPLRARNEEELANKLVHNKTLMPVQTLILFVESRHALGLRPIFRRKFGKALEIKKFKADFEFDHPWISTSSSLVWFFRNVVLGTWQRMKRRMGRGLRKRLKSLFWS